MMQGVEEEEPFCESCQLDYVPEEKAELKVEPSPSEEGEEYILKKDALEGNARIPVKEMFGFIVEHIAKTIGEQMGAGNEHDRNFTFFEQLKSRRRFAELTKYTFLHPLLSVNRDGADTLVAVIPYDKVKNSQAQLIDGKTWILYELTPRKLPEPGGLLEFHKFFESTIRTNEYADAGIQFSHILKSINECDKGGYLHFDLESANNSATQTKWAFQYHQGDLFVYKILNSPPFEALEESFKSSWISSTHTYFKRKIVNSAHFFFSREELDGIANDPEVVKLA